MMVHGMTSSLLVAQELVTPEIVDDQSRVPSVLAKKGETLEIRTVAKAGLTVETSLLVV